MQRTLLALFALSIAGCPSASAPIAHVERAPLNRRVVERQANEPPPMQPPTRRIPVAPNARVLPGVSFDAQSSGVQYPRAWQVGEDLYTLHAEGEGSVLRARLTRRGARAPHSARSSTALADGPVLAAFAQAAFVGDRAGIVFIDVRQGVRDSFFALVDQLRDRPRVRVTRRLGHTYSNYPSVAYNAEARVFGAVWSQDNQTTFVRFDADGAPVGAPVVRPATEFTWSNGVNFVSAGDHFTALARRGPTTQLDLIEFAANGAGDARVISTPLGADSRVIESALSWDGSRYAVAWSNDRAFSVALLEATDNGATFVRTHVIADRSQWAGGPSMAFDGRHHHLVWSDINGQSRVHRTIMARDGSIVATSLLASSPDEHAWFPFVSASDAQGSDVVVSYQLGQNRAFFVPLSQ